MKHQSTRLVFDYWNRKRGVRVAPSRDDINPAEIRRALSDTFMLAADFTGQLRFRLAGTRVCALFNREVKGEVFADLWNDESRNSVNELLEIVSDEAVGVVAGLTAHTEDGAKADVEMLLLPLAPVGYSRVRAIGVLAPLVSPWWLGAKPAATLTLGTLRHTETGADLSIAPRIVPQADSRRRHGLVVYSGGRKSPADEAAD